MANSRTIEPSTSPDLLTVAGDMADPETASRIVGTAIDSFGRVDRLVNNAGVFLSKPFVEYSESDLATAIGINLAGSFRLAQRAAVAMLREGTTVFPTNSAKSSTRPSGTSRRSQTRPA